MNAENLLASRLPTGKLTGQVKNLWRRFRWLWFGGAILAILTTPSAVADAIKLFRSDHSLGFVLPIAFAIRIVMIWWFLKLWWSTRPEKVESNSEPSQQVMNRRN